MAASELALRIEAAALATGAAHPATTLCAAPTRRACCHLQVCSSSEDSCHALGGGAGASETVATVGLWDQQPNIYNAVPRSVRIDVDIRDHDAARRDGVIAAALDGAAEIAAARKCGHSAEVMFEYPTAQSDPKARLPAHLRCTSRRAMHARRVSFKWQPFHLHSQMALTAACGFQGGVRVGKRCHARGQWSDLKFCMHRCSVPSRRRWTSRACPAGA